MAHRRPFLGHLVLYELLLQLASDGGAGQGHLAQVPVVPEQEVLANLSIVGEVELGVLVVEVIVDIEDVGHRPGKRGGLFEAARRVQGQ
ncbi:MAG: hypothetical protein E6I22_05615 [Chloroflexi bacterium]|nr:MAG: hypothetical protein E6I22_05615 [Chloroflexota bacterium]